MAGKPQAEKALERFPELGCFAVAVRRIVYEKGMTLDNAIKKKAESANPLGLPGWPEAGKAIASAEPCVLFCYRGRSRNHARGANCRDAEGSRSAREKSNGGEG